MSLEYKNIKIIEICAWDSFVKDIYKKPYDFQQQDGCKNRGVFYFSVPLIGEPEDFENEDVVDDYGVRFSSWLEKDLNKPPREFENKRWWQRNFYPHVEMIIDDLYKKGLIEEGEYGINIDW